MTLLSALFHAWQTAQKLVQNKKKVQYRHTCLVLWAHLLLSSAWLHLFVSVCVCHCPVLHVLFSLLSFWWTAFSWIQQLALSCWIWCSLFCFFPSLGSPTLLPFFSFHIRHFVSSIILNTVDFFQTEYLPVFPGNNSLLDAGNSCNISNIVIWVFGSI